MQLICYRLGMGLPVVVAGDNLNIPVLGSFLQHAGIILDLIENPQLLDADSIQLYQVPCGSAEVSVTTLYITQ